MIGGIQADQATSFQSMSSKVSQFVEIVKKDPASPRHRVHRWRQRNSGLMFVVLKPLKERAATADEISKPVAAEAGAGGRCIAVPAVGAGLARRWSIRQCAIPVHLAVGRSCVAQTMGAGDPRHAPAI